MDCESFGMSFPKRMLLHYVTFFTALQALSWPFGMDEAIRRLLSQRPLLVILGMCAYAGWYFLMYGSREKKYYGKYQKRKSELPACDLPQPKRKPEQESAKRRKRNVTEDSGS